MPYTIIKTDGTVLTDILDNSVDKIQTDLTLVGKSTQNYGLEFNQNFVKLLENFANTTEPKHPLTGQIWYDTSEGQLKIYTGSDRGWKEPNRPQVSSSQPKEMAPGDLWIDNLRGQLYFNDGAGTKLAGPIYTQEQGVSGYEVAIITDTNNSKKTIVKLKIGNLLLGVFSQESFTPNYDSTIPGKALFSEGMTGSLVRGFTPVSTNTEDPIKFYITAKNAENLIRADGTPINVTNFVQTNRETNSLIGTLNILNETALILGPSSNTTVEFNQSSSIIKNNKENNNFIIQVTDLTSTNDAIFIAAGQSRVGIFQSTPISTLDVNGDINVRGNIVSNNNSINIAEIGVQTINIGGATTTVNIGSPTGATLLRSDLTLQKNINANGGAITSTNTTFNLLNTNVDELNLGGAAANVNIGGPSGLATFNNNVLVEGNLTVGGETNIDNINIIDNVVSSTGTGTGVSGKSNLVLSSINGKVEFGVDAVASSKLTLKNVLEFDVPESATLTNINTSGAFFNLLPTNVINLYIGASSTTVEIGSSTSTSYFKNNLNVNGQLRIGRNVFATSDIDSTGDVTNLFNTNSRTINFGSNARTIIAGSEADGSVFNIRSPSTLVDGDLTIAGGDLRTTVSSASLFNTVATSIALGKSASNIEIGNDVGSTKFNHDVSVNGYIEINGRDGEPTSKKGKITVGESTTELDMFPEFLSTLSIAKGSSIINIGKAETPGTIKLPGTLVTINYDLKVLHDLLIPNIDANAGGVAGGGAGLLYRDNTSRMVASDFVRTLGSARALSVSGEIYYTGKLTGPDGIATIDAAKITRSLIIAGTLPVSGTIGPSNPAVGIISSTNTIVNMFDSTVTTLNFGGAGNETITLGSSTARINVLGNFIASWKLIDSSYQAVSGDRLLINASRNNVQITLPATPTVGDIVHFIDQAGFDSQYSLIIQRNGSLINGLANVLTINTDGSAFTLVYTGTARGWAYDRA
jgi:hypothetical protein